MSRIAHALIWTRRHLAGELDVPELPLLLPYLAPDDVFLDVGAHAGGWSVPISRALPLGHVYAFEALPHYAAVLRMTLALLRRSNVTVVAGAVTDRAGQVPIVWKDASGQHLTGMTHIGRPGESGTAVSVPSVTVDGFIEGQRNRVRLMKCDVEGAELMVLRGASATIERWRPMVFCELYDDYCRAYGHTASDVFGFFAARRYRPWTVDAGAFRDLSPDAYSGKGDVLFAPAEAFPEAPCA